jgi:hypothetical protein
VGSAGSGGGGGGSMVGTGSTTSQKVYRYDPLSLSLFLVLSRSSSDPPLSSLVDTEVQRRILDQLLVARARTQRHSHRHELATTSPPRT